MKEYENKIKRLEHEFGESNFNSDELVSSEYRAEINRKYNEKQSIFTIDSVLYQLKPNIRIMVKELCYNCKIEVIIAIIALYVWKTRYHHLREEQTVLWKTYDLSWKKYGLVIRNLLQKTREK